jgi:HEAT repeat protein
MKNDKQSNSESPNVVRERPRLSAMRQSGDLDGLISELDNPAEDQGEALGRIVLFTVREQAIQELAKMGDRRAVQPIARMLNDPVPQVRTHAAMALGKLGDRAAVPALVDSLRDEDTAVQAWSAKSLGRLGDQTVVPDLVRTLKSDNFYVRLDAAQALASLGDPCGVDPLKKAVRQESLRHPTYRLRMAKALRALRRSARGSSSLT